MYTNDSRVENNYSRGNHMGYALMYSSRLDVIGNVSIGDRDKGILLNYANDSRIIEGNEVHDGPEKCVFIYNANFNQIEGQPLQRLRYRRALHRRVPEENVISRNRFENNRTQVKYVGTPHLEWSSNDGVGNYWSDHVGFDRNGDGIADNHATSPTA